MTELSGMESTIVKQASDDLKRLSVMFSGILKIAPVLDQVVSLQQAAEESEGRVTVARDQEATLKVNIAGLNTQLAALTDQISVATLRADNAEVEAAGLVRDAAARMRDEAKTAAESVVMAARQQAMTITADADFQCRSMLARATADVDAKNAELVAASSALDTIKAALASAQQSFEELRAKVTK